MILDAAGRLAGTTISGGNHRGGVVFEVDQKGNETVLYQFCSQPSCDDGEGPYAGLLLDRAGNAYGTTYSGGAYNEGVVFKLSPH